jgi:hypothetical protein
MSPGTVYWPVFIMVWGCEGYCLLFVGICVHF